ncbi:MAG: hypothetical protein ABIA11_04220 [Patescibacteria group bacterium]
MSTQIVLQDVSGPLTDFFKKLESDQGGEWLRGFKKFLRKENPWQKLETFMEVEIGAYRSVKALRKALGEASMQVSSWADDILDKTKLSRSKKVLELVVMSVKELGFSEGAHYRQICEVAKNFGLELCPAEVGPYLRLQYQDQPKDEWLSIAMEAISDSDGDLRVFYVHRYGDYHWLYVSYGRPDYFWSSFNRFVFVRRK